MSQNPASHARLLGRGTSSLDGAQLIREAGAGQSNALRERRFGGKVLNGIFIALILGAVVTAAWTGQMAEVNQALVASAKSAVEIAIGLVGLMALWLGFMRVLRDAGVMQSMARGLAPLMRRLFPEIPADHPAMSAMILNIAANVLGLGNAATPFGLKAMRELDRLNPRKGVATDSMALFLAINTSGVAVLPLGVMSVRASLGAENVGGIIAPSVLATLCSTAVAVLVAKTLMRSPRWAVDRFQEVTPAGSDAVETLASAIPGLDDAEELAEPERPPVAPLRAWLSAGVALLVAVLLARESMTLAQDQGALGALRGVLEAWLPPLLLLGIALFGFSHRIKVYESVVQGAREGFQIAVMIIPFLVAILVSIGMFRASGALDALIGWAAPLTGAIGFPAEALPMALIRPLSGSGAIGVMTETMQAYGPDSFPGFLVSVMNGSTETTFYVLAVYYGSVRVRATRYTVAACLAADATGVLAALFFAHLFF
jgi:spore maturation protein SpmA